MRLRIFATGLTTCCLLFMGHPAHADIKNAIVKVFVNTNRIDFAHPWQTEGTQSVSGSGFVIKGNKILTNAHVVADNTFIQVRKEGDAKKYPAKVTAVGNDCDLALLQVSDPDFFKDVVPLEIGDLPEPQEKVVVMGYPMGGDNLSITEGVVSRIEIIPYAQSNKRLLAVQIDAAINPGNSGGPVLLDGKVIGVAMQIIWFSQNIGYTIPTPVIKHFLKDAEDGQYDGFPTVGVEHYVTENPALQRYFKIPKDRGGVLISWVMPFSSAEGELLPDDVLLSIEGTDIGQDGTFEFKKGERLALSYLITQKQLDETIHLQVLRKGKIQDISFPLKSSVSLVPMPNEITKPMYYIYGGLIFSTLSMDLLQAGNREWWKDAPTNYMEYLNGSRHLNRERKKEVVVLIEVLPDDINVGYHNFREEVIHDVNGKSFSSFEEFVRLVEGAEGDYITFETDQNSKIILSIPDAKTNNPAILSRNNIPKAFSDNIADWIKKTDSRE